MGIGIDGASSGKMTDESLRKVDGWMGFRHDEVVRIDGDHYACSFRKTTMANGHALKVCTI